MALALGSGGARGYAHIGVVQVLEERGYEIVSIAGTSMGALVGGLHAAGVLEAYAEWAEGLTQRDVLRLLDPSLKAPGAIRAEKVLARVGELLEGRRIEDLPVPFTAVATDLLARREVWFQRGPVDVAIRASIALPSFITPVMVNGRLLADGGLMNPIPLAPTTSAHADLTVAVSLAGEPGGPSERVLVQESAEPRPVEEWLDRFRRSAAQVMERDLVRRVAARFAAVRGTPAGDLTGDAAGVAAEAQLLEDVVGDLVEGTVGGTVGGAVEATGTGTGMGALHELEALPSKLRTLDVMELSLDALQSVVTRYRLAGYPPDLLVTVPKTACRTLDFHKAAEMVALGRELAEEALDRHEAAARD